MYRNPRERADAIRRAYAEEELDQTLAKSLFQNQRSAFKAQLRRLTDFAPWIRNGLEVGSYVGAFLSVAEDAGLSFTGLDLNEGAAAVAAKAGVNVSVGEIEDLNGDAEYDAITIWNTFEQLPDVHTALYSARRLLRNQSRRRGVLVVRIPNSGFYVKWRNQLGGPLAPIAERLLAFNNLLGFPYREGFSSQSISKLFDSCGFDIRRVHGDALVSTTDRWTRPLASLEEHVIKRIQRITDRGWNSAWVEVYATVR